MGFFNNLFKKKKGGTFVGNLIRGVANTATNGALGTGSELAQWEYDQQQQLQQQQQQQQTSTNLGNLIGSQLEPTVTNFVQNSQTAKNLQNQQVSAWFKRNVYYILAPVVLVVLYMFYKKKSK